MIISVSVSFSTYSALDRWKSIIGRVQHSWLLFACHKLGLTRFLLPLSIKAVRVRTYLQIRTFHDYDFLIFESLHGRNIMWHLSFPPLYLSFPPLHLIMIAVEWNLLFMAFYMNVISIFLNQYGYLHMCSLCYNYAITCLGALLPSICTPVCLANDLSLSLFPIIPLSIFLSNCQFLFSSPLQDAQTVLNMEMQFIEE